MLLLIKMSAWKSIKSHGTRFSAEMNRFISVEVNEVKLIYTAANAIQISEQ